MKKLWALAGRIIYWLGWPAIYLIMRANIRARVIIENHRGEILLIKTWPGPGLWSLPGGGIHRGEEPKTAACREIYEELGIQINPTQLKALNLEPEIANEFSIKYKYLAFYVLADSAELSVSNNFTVVDTKWFKPRDLLRQPLVEPTGTVVTARVRR